MLLIVPATGVESEAPIERPAPWYTRENQRQSGHYPDRTTNERRYVYDRQSHNRIGVEETNTK